MNLLERIERDRKGSSLLEQIERDRQKLNNPKPTPTTSTLLKPKAPQTTPNLQVNLNPVKSAIGKTMYDVRPETYLEKQEKSHWLQADRYHLVDTLRRKEYKIVGESGDNFIVEENGQRKEVAKEFLTEQKPSYARLTPFPEGTFDAAAAAIQQRLKQQQEQKYAEMNPILRFLHKANDIGIKGIEDTPSLGNAPADIAANVLGTILSFGMPTGGGSTMAGATQQAGNAATHMFQKSAPRVINKLPNVIQNVAKSPAGAKILERSFRGAAEGIPYNIMESIGKDNKQVLKNTAIDTAVGIGLENLFGIVGDVAGNALKKMKAGKALNTAEIKELNNLPFETKQQIVKELPAAREVLLLPEKATSKIELPAAKNMPVEPPKPKADFYSTSGGTTAKSLDELTQQPKRPLALPEGDIPPKRNGQEMIDMMRKAANLPDYNNAQRVEAPFQIGKKELKQNQLPPTTNKLSDKIKQQQAKADLIKSGEYSGAGQKYDFINTPTPYKPADDLYSKAKGQMEFPFREIKGSPDIKPNKIEPLHDIKKITNNAELTKQRSRLELAKMQLQEQMNFTKDKKMLNYSKKKIQEIEENIKKIDLQLFAEKDLKPDFEVMTKNLQKTKAKTTDFLNDKNETLAKSLSSGNDVLDELTRELHGVATQSDPIVKKFASKIKDKAGLFYDTKDIYRNMEEAFDKEGYRYVKQAVLDPFDRAKNMYVDTVKTYTDKVHKEIVQDLGIKKGSKLSAAVQWFGEGERMTGYKDMIDPITNKKIKVADMQPYTLADLKKEFPNDWMKIKKASENFRGIYDELIDKVNASRSKIYPTNPDKLVPKRKDYFRHFKDMSSSMSGLKNIFDTPAQIDPKLVGVSEFTQPKSKWASFMQHRGLGGYDADAVGGFLDYINPSAYAINIDPHITKFRQLAKDLAESTGESKNANNLIMYLRDFADDLAGKTNRYDRLIQDKIPGGRTAFKAINWLNGRVKSNQVLGNAKSVVSQLFNIPHGIAEVKNPVHLAKGAGDVMASMINKGNHNKLYKQSPFLKERYMSALIDRFDTKLINQPQKFAAWMMNVVDEVSTKYMWSSVYNSAKAKSIVNPIKYADDVTRKLVAGRGIGEVPLLQKSKLFQLVAPFQLEVGNMWHVMQDFVKRKDFGAIAVLAVSNYLFNMGAEKITGSGTTFDPINAMLEAIEEEDTNLLQKAGRMGGEVVSNMPAGQTIAAMLPEDFRKKYFGKNDPSRYGSGLLVMKGIQDPLTKIIPPYGGAQIKKTYEGLKSTQILPNLNPLAQNPIDKLQKGENPLNPNFLKKQQVSGSMNKNDKLRFPIEKTPTNIVKSALFGQYSSPEATQYFKDQISLLGEKQTAQYTELVNEGINAKELYNQILSWRKLKPLDNKNGVTKKQKVDDLFNNGNFTDKEKILIRKRLLDN